MITTDLVQAALITFLNNKLAITTLTTDIRELYYQGTDFSYPCLRVRIDPIVPLYPTQSCDSANVTWEIIAESEQPSSIQVQQLAAAVVNNIKRKNINSANAKSGQIRILSLDGPTRMGERGWRQRIFCQAEFR